jgi:wyosine [tRNA(Phe)-imidazoG37] synthetase (radical SAM superfamily)
MPVLPLETGIIYGPLRSRRLGLSLGVNLLPVGEKVCAFDCVYCHYGRTTVHTMAPSGLPFPSVPQVRRAVERALRRHPDVAYLTFSGNGEPTLHPFFPQIVADVVGLRDALAPDVKVALFSNATTVHRPAIRAALTRIDAPILKLDAGDAETLARVNRPVPAVTLDAIVAGLQHVPDLIVQSVLVDGTASNARGAALDAWMAALAEIRPARLQLYSTDYPVPDRGVERVLPYELDRIAVEVRDRTGVQVETYYW